MSLTSEMSRIAAGFEAAQGARLAAIGRIGARMRQEKHGNKASLRRSMAAHRVATKSSLRDIFGTAAFTRGAAEEMIERFRNEREELASGLRDQLSAYASNLRDVVGETLANLAATRVKTARRDESARRAQLKDLRRRVTELEIDLDLGKIGAEEYDASEAMLLQQLNEIREAKNDYKTESQS